MIKLFGISEAIEWDLIVRSFSDYDVYYLSGYVRAFQIYGDGEPFLFYYEENGIRGIYVFLRRQTALDRLYDSITPYGYGGFLMEGNCTRSAMRIMWDEYVQKMKELNIADDFVRYHPVLANASRMRSCSEVIDLGKTVTMDIVSAEMIWENIHSKNRNMIRKAEKNGIIIKHGKGMDLFDDFMILYNSTMEKDKAESYYFFSRDFYQSIDRDLHDNYEIFWAEYEGKKISMSIMIFANGRLNYHLSGSDNEYRNLAPTNLLLYKAALWGCENGMKTFHLGGGIGSVDDSLYKFKATFNKKSNTQFSIAKHIFDDGQYAALIEERVARDPNFDKESLFFPIYRQ